MRTIVRTDFIAINAYTRKNWWDGSWKMTQQLRVLGHDLGVISNTHMVADNQPNIQLQGAWCPFLASAITRHMWCTYINAEKNHAEKNSYT